jgi:hypothetical protein
MTAKSGPAMARVVPPLKSVESVVAIHVCVRERVRA